MEYLPVKLILILLVITITAGIGFWQVGHFLDFKTESDFKSNAVEIFQTVRNLQSGGDFGSVTTLWLRVPSGYWMNFSIDGDQILLYGKQNFSVNLTANVSAVSTELLFGDSTPTLGEVRFDPGDYKFRLFYGRLEKAQVKPLTIVFE